MTKHHEKITQLLKVFAAQEANISALVRQNEELHARQAALLLQWQTSRETISHRQAHSPADASLAAVEARLRQLEESIFNACGQLRNAGSGTGSSSSSSNRGAAGGANAVERLCGVLGDGSVAPPLATCPGGNALLSTLPHLAFFEGDLLRLNGVTPEEVQRARSDSPEAVFREWRGLVEEAHQYVAAGSDSHAAAAGLHDVGVRLKRTHTLRSIWALLPFVRAGTTHFTSLEPSIGPNEAPAEHWAAVVVAVRLTRMQALVIVELFRILCAKLQRLSRVKARLAAELSATDAAAAAAGTAGPGAALGYRGEPGEERNQVMQALEGNLRLEEQYRVEFATSAVVVLTPAQFARLFGASWPYPPNNAMCVKVLENMLGSQSKSFARTAC